MKVSKRRKRRLSPKHIVIPCVFLLPFLIAWFALPVITANLAMDVMAAELPMEEVSAEMQDEAHFDWSSVDEINERDFLAIFEARDDIANQRVIGRIRVPSVGISLNVFQGVNNTTMTIGAGTMLPNQVMGEGNFALASHRMRNPNVLFSPLERIAIGATIELESPEGVFLYEVTDRKIIHANDVHYIVDKPDYPIVSLLTCVIGNRDKRLLVIGRLK